MTLLCIADISNGHLSAVTHCTAVKPVTRLPTADVDVSSDGEEFCDSFDMSSFRVRQTEMICWSVLIGFVEPSWKSFKVLSPMLCSLSIILSPCHFIGIIIVSRDSYMIMCMVIIVILLTACAVQCILVSISGSTQVNCDFFQCLVLLVCVYFHCT